jgi:two-component system, chemotaxis family, chemotaxis protein CheY
MKILVVDDSKAMRMIVIRTLRQAGFDGHEIIEAENGALGLESIAANKPDIVLSDWNMPEMTGIELLTALRAKGDSTTFGFVTSETTPEMREQAITGGASFVLAKPFTPEEMAESIGVFVK